METIFAVFILDFYVTLYHSVSMARNIERMLWPYV